MRRHEVIYCDRGWMPGYYGFCPSEAAWKREMKRLKIEPPEPYPTSDGRTVTFEKTDQQGLTCLVTIGHHIDKKNDRLGIIGLIVHEAMHVWRHIREDAGETAPSAEFEAYALQNIVQQLAAAYSKTRRRL